MLIYLPFLTYKTLRMQRFVLICVQLYSNVITRLWSVYHLSLVSYELVLLMEKKPHLYPHKPS